MFEAWENELFDKYNCEAHETEEEFWARMYETYDMPARYWEPSCEEYYHDEELDFDDVLPF